MTLKPLKDWQPPFYVLKFSPTRMFVFDAAFDQIIVMGNPNLVQAFLNKYVVPLGEGTTIVYMERNLGQIATSIPKVAFRTKSAFKVKVKTQQQEGEKVERVLPAEEEEA
jgi:hypothetical protein